MQNDHPEVTVDFGLDQAMAAASRSVVFAEAADQQYIVGGVHFAFLGIGAFIDCFSRFWSSVTSSLTAVHGSKIVVVSIRDLIYQFMGTLQYEIRRASWREKREDCQA